jgi:hypothetical protein
LLRTALDMGITHCDVARMYGLGEAEAILGAALKSAPDEVTVGTKFGLPFVPAAGGKVGLQSMARYLFNLSPGLKKAIRKFSARGAPAATGPQPVKHYTVEEMEKSLGESLRKLQRESVDLLFLHEPGLNDVIADDLAGALRAKKASGEIGAFGLSAHRPEVEKYLQERPEICGDAIQYYYPMLAPGADGRPVSYPFTGMFSVVDSTLGTMVEYLARKGAFARTWSEKLGLDLTRRENVGIVILAIALSLNPGGLVLFFTSRPQRLREMTRVLNENSFTAENLPAFREAMLKDIHAN